MEARTVAIGLVWFQFSQLSFLATIDSQTFPSRASNVKQTKNTSETVAQLCPRAAGTEADLSAECGNLGGRTQGKEVCHTLNIFDFL